MKLNIIFKIYNKIIKLNIEFYDFNFNINLKKKDFRNILYAF